jgi:hypothetical protein
VGYHGARVAGSLAFDDRHPPQLLPCAAVFTMPKEFSKLGVRFLYPDNWRLDEDEALEGNAAVSVYGPGGAFWTVFVHPRDDEPAALVEAVVSVIREEYDEVDVQAVDEPCGVYRAAGYDLNFYCLDLTNTAFVRGFQTAEATYVVLAQAEDRDLEVVEPVFRAISQSLSV